MSRLSKGLIGVDAVAIAATWFLWNYKSIVAYPLFVAVLASIILIAIGVSDWATRGSTYVAPEGDQ